ncbi:hypothetical protein C8Q74DRAFT_1371483 [Fomes fomentarius]|nr:hypothetical protein C8Q74DRAFT_1371483 [Fomes fomentarius]
MAVGGSSSRGRRARIAQAASQSRRRPQEVLTSTIPEARPPREDILFPVEVWKLIFEFLYSQVSQQQCLQVLRFLAALRCEAESVLYTKPRVIGTESAVTFTESVTAAHEPHRAYAVRELSMVVSTQDAAHGDMFYDAMARVLGKLPRLQSIGLMGIPSRGNAPLIRFFMLPMLLKNASFPSLRYLRGDALFLTSQAEAFLNEHQGLEEVRLLPIQGFADLAPPAGNLARVRLPKLRALGIDTALVPQLQDHHTKNLTHLWLTNGLRSEALDEALELFGMQLLGLRIEQTFVSIVTRVLPTARPVRWDHCKQLRFLQLPWEPKDADFEYTPCCWVDEIAHLPPVLETLVWAPMWTRRYHDVGPTWKQRSVLRHYAEDLLNGRPSLKDVLYLWNDEGYRHCYLSNGNMMEGWADPQDTDGDAWAHIM